MTVLCATAAFLAALAATSAAMYSSAPVPRAPGQAVLPVVIDAGHGGADLGAVVKGVREKDIALVVALKLKARLKDLPVLLTRVSDHYVPLDKRVIDSVDGDGAVFVSIHLNAVRGKQASGATIYSYGPEPADRHRRPRRHPGVPPLPAPPRIAATESEVLGRSMAQFLRAAGIRVESAKSDYYVLKNPAQPSVLVELGFLSNPGEAVKLAGAAYQNLLVECLAKAIEEYVNQRALRPETGLGAGSPKDP